MTVRSGLCVAISALVFGAACGDSSPGRFVPTNPPTNPSSDDDDEDPPVNMRMVILLDQTSVAAGDPIEARCLRTDGTRHYPLDGPVLVDVTPIPDTFAATSDGAVFSSLAPGRYEAVCKSVDGSAAPSTPAHVDIQGLLAVTWDVDFFEQDCFSATDRLSFRWSAYDAYGNVANINVEATAEPADGAVGDAYAGFRFTKDGDYAVTLRVISPLDPAADIEPVTAYVHVDATPPVVTLTSPERGAMLTGGGAADTPVNVTGFAEDATSTIVGVRIDDIALPVSGGSRVEDFELDRPSRWGLSMITGRAEDACGNVGWVAHSFLRSPSYYPAVTHTSAEARVQNALLGQVSQDFIDDGDRSDIDDLATLAETAISNIDFDSMLAPGAVLVSKPVRNDCDSCFWGPTFVSVGVDAWRHPDAGRHINISGPWILNVDFLAGAVGFGVRIDDFAFPLRAKVKISQCAIGCETYDEINVNAWVGFSRLQAQGDLGISIAGGEAIGSVEAIDFNLDGAYLDIDCGIFDWACDEITDLLINAVVDKAEAAVEDAVREMVPPVIAESLTGFSIEQSMDLPDPLNMTMNVAAYLDTLAFCGPASGARVPVVCGDLNTSPGSATLGLSTQIYPSARGEWIPTDAPGPIRAGSVVTPQFSSASTSFGVGLREDMVNQLFWALWYGGALEIPDVTEMMGELAPEGLAMSVHVGLPPVLMPGRNGSALEVGIGDVQVEASVDVGTFLGTEDPFVVDVSMTMAAVAGMIVEFDDVNGALRVGVADDLKIAFDVHYINDARYAGSLSEALSVLVAQEVPNLLAEAMMEIPIPEFDLSAVPGVPAGTVWRLKNASLDHADGYFRFRGSVGP